MRCNTCLKQLGMIKWVKISRICRRGWPTRIKSCNTWQSIQVQACPKSSQRFHDINIMPRFHYQSLSITIIHVVLSLQLTHCRPEKMFQTQTKLGDKGKRPCHRKVLHGHPQLLGTSSPCLVAEILDDVLGKLQTGCEWRSLECLKSRGCWKMIYRFGNVMFGNMLHLTENWGGTAKLMVCSMQISMISFSKRIFRLHVMFWYVLGMCLLFQNSWQFGIL